MSDELEGTRREAPVDKVSRLVKQSKEFGGDFKPLTSIESYYPTRLEYFAGKALQGMVTGRSIKDYPKIPAQAIEIAIALEELCDKAQD